VTGAATQFTAQRCGSVRRNLQLAVDGGRSHFKFERVKHVTSEDLRWEQTRVAAEVVAGRRLIVTFRGKPHFALVPLADLEQLEGKPVVVKATKRKPTK
jgi:prevent-host-death family protein